MSQDEAWEASDPMRGAYWSTKEPTQGVSRAGRLGVPLPERTRGALPRSGLAAQGELPAFFFLFLLHELSQTSSARFTQEPGLLVRTFYYFRGKHLQSASE